MRTQALSAVLLGLMLGGPAGCQGARLPEACDQKPESGRCRAAHQRYYFNRDAGECKAFVWGGCGGVVPFATLEQCRASCEREPVDEADPRLRRSY